MVESFLVPGKTEPSEAAVRSTLAYFGAPLNFVEPEQCVSLHEAVVFALRFAQDDSTLFRVLPVVLERNRARLDLERATRLASEHDLLASWGMLLDLTGEACGVQRFSSQASKVAKLVENRERGLFFRARSSFEVLLAERRTPAVVRRWGFLLNMPLELFRSMSEKHA